jgi:chemotaxis protein methyltransferase CheR
MTDLVKLTDREFKMLSSLIYDKTGITLGDHKQALVVGRLNKELRESGFTSFTEYYNHVVNDPTGQAINTLIEKISTNHTYFWRESDHFTMFQNVVLPELTSALKKGGSREIRIWCAGCSSGEEPYTLAMLLHEHLGKEIGSWDAGILATDISDRVLKKAISGAYDADNVNRLPPNLKRAYFERADGDRFVASDNVKKLIMFRKLNLMRESFPFRRRFHMIFCRNVMIYFDTPTRMGLVERFHRYMESGGYLFIGHSESLGRSNELFRYLKPAVYRKGEER